MRVLHLIDPASPGGGACTLFLLAEAIARLNSVQQQVIVISNRRRTDLARRCGITVFGQLNAPLGIPALASGSLKYLHRLQKTAGWSFDIIHSWTIESALLAARAFPHHKHVAMLTVGPTPGPTVRMLARHLQRRPMPILVTSPGVFAECAAFGIDTELISMLPPAVHPQAVHMTARQKLRDRWGIDEDTFVVGLLSVPWSWADTPYAIDILARLESAGRRVRLLVHHRAARRVEAERWAKARGMPECIITDNEIAEPWKIVNGLDAALFTGGPLNSQKMRESGSLFSLWTGGGQNLRPMPGTLALLWAMAAEVPVVAEDSSAVKDVIEDGRNGLLIRQGDRPAATDRLIRLHDDRALGRRLGGSALETVHKRFGFAAYAVRLKDTYEHIMAGLSPHVLGVDNRPWVARHEPATETWTMH